MSQCMAITSPVVAEVVVNKDEDGCQSNVGAYNTVAKEDPLSDDGLIVFTGRFLHDVRVGWVEGQSSSRESISDEIDP